MNQHSILAAVVDDRGFQALGLLASWATLLLGSAWLTASLLRRASSAVRYCVWQYALVALLAAPAAFSLLPGIPLGISLTATGPPSSGSRRWGDSPSDLRPRLTDELPNGPIRESQAEHVPPRGGIPQVTTENRGNAATIANSANDAQSALVAWSTATVGGWVLGVAAQLGWLLWCMARASRLVRAAQTVDDARIRRLTHELDVRFAPGRQVRLMMSRDVRGPLLAGVRRPTILLPYDCAGWTDEKLQIVLSHELAHVERRDVLWQLAARAAAAVYWFHPLAWLALRRMRQERERACDDRVLSLGVPAVDYAAGLAEFAAAMVGRPSPLAGSLGMADQLPLEDRVRSILNPSLARRPASRRVRGLLLATTACLVLVLGTVRPFSATPSQAAEEPKANVKANDNDPPKREDKPAAASAEKLAPQALSVSCADKNNKPVAGAEVHLFQRVVGEPGRYKHFGPFTSDEQGQVTCPRAVVYDGSGHFDRWAYARVSGQLVGIARSVNWKGHSPSNSEFRVRLLPSRSVEGQVTVPEGFDVTQVTVRVQNLDIKTGDGDFDFESFPRYLPFAGLDTALLDVFERRPDAQGHIRFDDVPVRGRLYLLTEATGLAEAQWRNEDNVFDEPIRLMPPKEGFLTGRILSPDGKPAVGMKVAARLSFIPGRQIFHLSTFRATTDENGQFAVHGLPETPFVLSVEDPSHQWTVRPRERLSIATGETQDIAVSMEVGVYVSGRVFDPEGRPVEAAALSALADTQEGPSLADDMTDRQGRYRLLLPSGRARLYFNALPDGFVYPNPNIINRLDITPGQDAIERLDFTIYRNANDARAAGESKRVAARATAKQAEPDPAVAKRIVTIAQEHERRETQFHTELSAAQHDNQKVRDANDRYFADKRERAGDLMYVIAEHAADPAAFDGVLLLVEKMNYFLDDSLTEIVLDHHLADPRMGRLCFALRYRGGEAWAARILKAVAEKHPEGNVRGQAVFALGDSYRNQAFPYGRELPEAERAALLAEAGRCYQRTVDEFAQTPTPDGKTTLGDKARHELTRLRNLSDLKVGRPAPPIAAEALDGKPMSLADFRGQVVLLVFWGSWCGPCMKMVPHERELAQRYRGKPFALVGVNCGDTRDVAQATMEQHHMTWRCWWDGDETRGPIETDYDVPHWPRVFLIDADGIIRAIDPEPDDLDRAIEALLQVEEKS